MKKSLIATTLTAVLVLGVGAVAAGPRGGQGGPGGPGGPGGMGPIGLLMQLDLTEEQRDELKAILESFQPRVEEHRATMGELRDELKQIVKDSGYNEALIVPIADSIGDAAKDGALIRAEMGAAMREVLTEEQLELLEAIADERGDRPAGPFGRGR